jgi:hypothetical protein
MDNFTRLNGSSPISPSAERVWRINKKRKTDDHRQRRNGKRFSMDRNDTEKEIDLESYGAGDDIGLDSGEDTFYGITGSRKRLRRKVDVII